MFVPVVKLIEIVKLIPPEKSKHIIYYFYFKGFVLATAQMSPFSQFVTTSKPLATGKVLFKI